MGFLGNSQVQFGRPYWFFFTVLSVIMLQYSNIIIRKSQIDIEIGNKYRL